MNLLKRHLSDEELAGYFQQLDFNPEKIDDNCRSETLILQQTDPEKGYPRLVKNMQTYSQGVSIELPVETIPVRLMLNQTRLKSLTSGIFEKKRIGPDDKACNLCNLDRGQRGIVITLSNQRQYIVLTNPGITLPGDLTIAAIRHENQLITGRFGDMIEIARLLNSFAIYFNGALAGASTPHLHFQAGYKDKLIGEIQIQKMLAGQSVGQARMKRILKNTDLEVYVIENYLRAVHIVVTKNPELLSEFFNRYLAVLNEVSHSIRGIPNIPDFGSLIPALGIGESEPRLNIMLKYYPDYDGYILALFPKTSNRPQCYFKKGKEQILVGFGIKESLGNLITAREKDYVRLEANPELIFKIFSDTSIAPESIETLNELLRKSKRN
ncbi:MAG: DUF4922 domain-containing protein [Candidatus Marinimicrobia bacterium]|jgi:uncharacterized protein involved in tellurium resistance|nr:DUF4922 domain-containing protein [Candidatus Neomarinimicrobiota bacterium]MCK9559024.1 DUF4922 domain-containing protein [Candidatus Neomarinimicrobiota bacterium]MDD5061337.1 DUF4922 domain-containing protein [Candidatus Neomarinimicrobiota bacterium]MDD5539410.1 DUF4922 domain-containing protein [Candidatus Neomarinimicrobiota bacterium]